MTPKGCRVTNVKMPTYDAIFSWSEKTALFGVSPLVSQPGYQWGGGGAWDPLPGEVPPPPPPPPPQKTEDNINLILNWLHIPRSEHVKTCQLVTTLCMI